MSEKRFKNLQEVDEYLEEEIETEKRFTTDYSDLLKNDKTFIKMDNERLTYEEIVDLLNEMNEDIQYLNAFLVEQGLAEEYIRWKGDV